MSKIRHRRAIYPFVAAPEGALGDLKGIAHISKISCELGTRYVPHPRHTKLVVGQLLQLKSAWQLLRAMAVILVAVALGSLGCGSQSRPGTARLEGTVTIGGQPIPEDAQASLTFTPMAGGRSAGAAVTNGRYLCDGAPIGKVKLYPNIVRRTGRMLTESDNRPYSEMASIIATKYATGIELEIDGDNSDQNFDLEPAEQFAADRQN